MSAFIYHGGSFQWKALSYSQRWIVYKGRGHNYMATIKLGERTPLT